jgi:biotin carboxyl carrier protein
MSTYYILVGKNEYQVEINGNVFTINGEIVSAALEALRESGLYLLRRGDAWRRELHVQPQGNSQYIVDANGKHVVAKVEKGNAHLYRKTSAVGEGDLLAPMPGMVVSVHVTEGDQIVPGQLLVVLESMKMQMEMRAACAGKVSQVNAQPKCMAAKGDVLVKIEVEEA